MSSVQSAIAQARLRELAGFFMQPAEQISQTLVFLGADPLKLTAVAHQVSATSSGAGPLPLPPRSWSKDARKYWAALPHELQEYLVERERSRDREVRMSQDEAARARQEVEKLKALLAPAPEATNNNGAQGNQDGEKATTERVEVHA
jgi:hypothetical protein